MKRAEFFISLFKHFNFLEGNITLFLLNFCLLKETISSGKFLSGLLLWKRESNFKIEFLKKGYFCDSFSEAEILFIVKLF